jgi:hypothetical protein
MEKGPYVRLLSARFVCTTTRLRIPDSRNLLMRQNIEQKRAVRLVLRILVTGRSKITRSGDRFIQRQKLLSAVEIDRVEVSCAGS